jgi:serine/threonine-protein kinase
LPQPQSPPRRRGHSLVGVVLDGRFRIDAKIASGGFATVYRATHIDTGVEMALKVLHADLANDEKLVARFWRESAALEKLRDPHTVTTYAAGSVDGTLYIAMELLRGESLLRRFRSVGRMGWRGVLEIARAVCSSLAEAHQLAIVHRDLKPANIHLEHLENQADFVKVLDFGVAKVLTSEAGAGDGLELTRIGEAIGTIDYMAPEQLLGGEVDGRTDIYALGVVMYELITGARPFEDSTNPTGLAAAMLTRHVPAPSTKVHDFIPQELDKIILRCLEPDPRERFDDVAELVSAIDGVMTEPLPTPTVQVLSSKRRSTVPGDDDPTWIGSLQDSAMWEVPTKWEKPSSRPPTVAVDGGGAGLAVAAPTPATLDPTQPMAVPIAAPMTPTQPRLARGSARPIEPLPGVMPLPHPEPVPSRNAPLPMFQVRVAGTDVRPSIPSISSGPAAPSAPTIVFRAIVLLLVGLAIGAIIAAVT